MATLNCPRCGTSTPFTPDEDGFMEANCRICGTYRSFSEGSTSQPLWDGARRSSAGLPAPRPAEQTDRYGEFRAKLRRFIELPAMKKRFTTLKEANEFVELWDRMMECSAKASCRAEIDRALTAAAPDEDKREALKVFSESGGFANSSLSTEEIDNLHSDTLEQFHCDLRRMVARHKGE
jgi:hypothetical protein